jgi:hypothetical protein
VGVGHLADYRSLSVDNGSIVAHPRFDQATNFPCKIGFFRPNLGSGTGRPFDISASAPFFWLGFGWPQFILSVAEREYFIALRNPDWEG